MKTNKTSFIVAVLLPLASLTVHAQTATTGGITAASTSDSSISAPETFNNVPDLDTGGGATVDLTYNNNRRTLNQFSVGSDTYTPLAITPDSVVLKRSTNTTLVDNSANNIVWSERVDDTTLKGPRFDSSDLAFAQNNMFVGMDNMIQNTGDNSGNNSPVQRVDVIFESGVTINESLSFAIFERGGNDDFKIAAITALDTNDDPSNYGDVLSLTSSDWGSGLYSADTTVTRSHDSEDKPYAVSNRLGSQDIYGINIGVNDSAGLNIANGTDIFGYSIFAADVTATGTDLTQWDNSSFFPTDTSTDSGLDLMAYHGIYVVPEPGAIVLAGILLVTAFFGLKRRK